MFQKASTADKWNMPSEGINIRDRITANNHFVKMASN